MAKILIIEDDLDCCKVITDRLEHEHHTVEFAHSGTDGLDKLLCCHYDLVILDWILPEMIGLEVLKRSRERGSIVPVLMLTGKDAELDKEAGLDSGADDYLTKPFSARELSARVRALLRRTTDVTTSTITRGDFVLDLKLCQLSRNGVPIALQPAEYSLMEFFMRNPGHKFSADDLVNKAWHSESEATANSVRIIITRLRKKIDVEGSPSVIVTSNKVGYSFEPPQMS
jgi:two-component system, OmpR family, response regulator ArlR